MKYLLLYLGITSALTATQALQAATVGSGTADSCSESAFEAALTAGGQIDFNCGGNVTIQLNSEKTIPDGTTIDGGGQITFDGREKNRAFITEDGTQLTLRGLSIINGFTTEQGGGIQLGRFNTFVAEDVMFMNNRATRDSQACDGGGAIFTLGGSTITLTRTQFINNRANNGGAINNLRSDLTVSDSLFQDNKAIHTEAINKLESCGGGGAIYIDGARRDDGNKGAVLIERTRFINNETNNLGGAIFNFLYVQEDTNINDSVFEGNRAYIQGSFSSSAGGAIWHGLQAGGSLKGTGTLFVNGSLFTKNSAARSGGALYSSEPVTITNSTFFSNEALNPAITDKTDFNRGFGGAMRLRGNTKVINSTIAFNKAGFVAGAIEGNSSGKPTIINTIIAFNTAENAFTTNFQAHCNTTLIDGGGNIQIPALEQVRGNDSNCFSKPNSADPLLQTEPADNGGPTLTLALQDGSPAIGAANKANCPKTDQRGAPRDSSCDIGAFEFGATPPGGGTGGGTIEPSISNGTNFNLGNRQMTPSGTRFKARLSVKGTARESKATVEVASDDPVSIDYGIEADSQSKGKRADILIVVAIKGNSGNTVWRNRQNGRWTEVPLKDGVPVLENIQTDRSVDSIVTEESVNVVNTQPFILGGEYTLYIAYRLYENNIPTAVIANFDAPIRIRVRNY